MPRKRAGITKGKRWQDFASMSPDEFAKLPVADKAAIVDKLAGTVNKRYKRFLADDNLTPAVRELMEGGGKISSAKKTKSGDVDTFSLNVEFNRAQRFLNRLTSSAAGFRQWRDHIMEGLAKNGIKFSKSQFKEFWRLYDEIAERDRRLEERKVRYLIMKFIVELMTDRKTKLTPEEIIKAGKARLEELYKAEIDREKAEEAELMALTP